ncbi:heterokaryon incompatibility protein-domain-containing protein [Suillus paluster]|uniref:heterokaryon incompatibility protein-domain-containing protein n=1 Tax=Suillus paluster TaxID=48578 RepID=UPI001B85B564|nr:heterokaryon incompatibility protein-domain-containing protein [Suillus paluster]KAG1742321.1 heterokaryon incompatibility protein-domain-containing protein [Suillus paluster]
MLAQPQNILQVSLKSLSQECALDITPFATPQRYRLIDCDQFMQNEMLCIDEFVDFPSVQYAALSYVWKGNPVDPSDAKSHHSFSVAGALDGDPISIHVLKHACLVAVKHGVRYIWLDRLCIMQTNREDKNWQIKQMSKMYKRCNICVVLPGGVQKLVRIDEETAWIHRGWTLQELLMPERVIVLLAWKLGEGSMMADDASGSVSEVTPQESAVMSATDVLNACVAGYLSFTSTHSPSPFLIRSCVFGAASPNLSATTVAMSEELASDPDARDHAIWQSALMRTSSRPVDMVFSIMGLFGVILDPSMFHKDDRLGATIALAKEILRTGGRASWLGMSFRLPPCSTLCTFPMFAGTSVSGKALVRTKRGLREVAEFVDGEYPNELGLGAPLPGGSMDDAGYFTFSARAVHLVPRIGNRDERADEITNSDRRLVTSMNGKAWEIVSEEEHGDSTSPRNTYGIILGWFQDYYPGATLAHNKHYIKGAVVEEHAPEKFHIVTFFSLHLRDRQWVKSWQERQFTVGGPNALTHTGDDAFDENEGYQLLEENKASRRHVAGAKARWARSQIEAEDDYMSKYYT